MRVPRTGLPRCFPVGTIVPRPAGGVTRGKRPLLDGTLTAPHGGALVDRSVDADRAVGLKADVLIRGATADVGATA